MRWLKLEIGLLPIAIKSNTREFSKCANEVNANEIITNKNGEGEVRRHKKFFKEVPNLFSSLLAH